MKIVYSQSFIKQFKKLHKDLKEEVYEKVKLLKKDQKNKFLKVHKLHGKFKKFQAFSVNYSVRIIFWEEKDLIVLAEVGNHDIYK